MQASQDRMETRLGRLEPRQDRMEAGLDQVQAGLGRLEARQDRTDEALHRIRAYLELDVEKRFDAVNEGIDAIFGLLTKQRKRHSK